MAAREQFLNDLQKAEYLKSRYKGISNTSMPAHDDETKLLN